MQSCWRWRDRPTHCPRSFVAWPSRHRGVVGRPWKLPPGVISHCEERNDEAIQCVACGSGLLRFARNDVPCYFCVKNPTTASVKACGCSTLEIWAASKRVMLAPGILLRIISPAETGVDM